MGRGNRATIFPEILGQFPAMAEEVAYIVDGSGPDGKFVWGSDDLKKKVKTTMADYLSCLTSEKNSYAVDSGLNETSVQNEDGSPAAIVTGGENSETFVSGNELQAWKSDFLDVRDPSRAMTVADYLSKGKPKATGEDDGHTLLKNVIGTDVVAAGSRGLAQDGTIPPTKLQAQVSRVLSTNRFNPNPGTSPFVEAGRLPEAFSSLHSRLGVSEVENAENDLTYAAVEKIGSSLVMMATGQSDGSRDPDDVILGLGGDLAVQTGLKRLSRGDMSVRNAFGVRGIPRVSLESDLASVDESDDLKSYGQMNSSISPFSGLAPVNMTIQAVTLTGALLTSINGIYTLLNLITPNTPPGAANTKSGQLTSKVLGLTQTRNPYFECVKRGMNVFFGYDTRGDLLAGNQNLTVLRNGLINVIGSPGYYATIVKNVLRSVNGVATAVKDVDFSNPIEGVQAAVGVIDIVRRSGAIGFFNVCALIGDIVIDVELKGNTVGDVKSDIDRIDDSWSRTGPGVVQKPGVAVFKGKSKTGVSSRSLAWRGSSSPTLMALPTQLLVAGRNFGDGVNVMAGTVAGAAGRKFIVTDKPRLDTSEVVRMEEVLEAEYVPFYFHDLRTNEIVSFHAFLDSLSDKYGADYTKQAGFGRVEPVMIYKATERSIDLSFIVAATSEEDFDEMWLKINKIVTLMYPQWGRGRQVSTADKTLSFTQPFSQVMTASPMIRMRIGDVVKSNYSKFNLARVFGLGKKDFRLPGLRDSVSELSTDERNKIDIIARKVAKKSADPSVTGDLQDGFKRDDKIILRPSPPRGYTDATADARASRRIVTHADIRGTIRVRLPATSTGEVLYIVQLEEDARNALHVDIVNATHADLKVDVVDLVTSETNFSAADKDVVKNFFSSEENPVMKSFESMSGRGLAGFITSLSFDWSPKEMPWETSFGRRAPKVVKIDMSFSPVHDITPGIDDTGFNRAPIYAVGDAVRNVTGDVRDGKLNSERSTYDEVMRELSKQSSYVNKEGS